MKVITDMSNNGIVNIHGKDYMTVAGRLELAKEDLISVETEVLQHDPVVIKAKITTKKGTYTGISSANPAKSIEKNNPYEVAETSAVGRALGFAGYGVIESIASADEMIKSTPAPKTEASSDAIQEQEKVEDIKKDYCYVHDYQMKERTNREGDKSWYDHRHQLQNGDWDRCYGKGWLSEMEGQSSEDIGRYLNA